MTNFTSRKEKMSYLRDEKPPQFTVYPVWDYLICLALCVGMYYSFVILALWQQHN